MFKDIFTIALSLVFVVTVITGIFSAGKLVNIGLERALGVENCDYRFVQEPKTAGTTPEQVCTPDTNRTKKDTANSLAMLFATVPASIFAYRKINNSSSKNQGKKKKR